MKHAGSNALNFNDFEVLTFDCYGTLIDWESGLLGSLRTILTDHGIHIPDEEVLELYGELESEAERGEYLEYKKVMRTVLERFGSRFHFMPAQIELENFSASVKAWLPFPDSPLALQTLKKKYKLAVVSNIDDDLFAYSEKRLNIKFDWIITAEQVRSYKPSLNNFRLALERIGVPKEKVLRVAQSLFHDIAPAKSLGLSTVWVNRRHDKEGFGATPPAEVQPDLEVPDLQTLVELIGKSSHIDY